MLELTGIYKTFGTGDAAVPALRGASIQIRKNEMVAIMGKSGSGKSTLLNIMGALLSFDSGTYRYNGKEVDFRNNSNLVNFRRNHVGFIVQYFALIEDMTVYENVALPLKYQKQTAKEIKRKVIVALKILGIQDKVKAYPNELSGGQQQRVGIARAIVKNPDIILADEPTGALDGQTEWEVLNIFMDLQRMGKTIVIVTHDENVAACCRRIIYLKDGIVA